MSTTLVVDRSRVCAFLSPGGRGCTMPLSFSHPFLCTYHARKEAQAAAAQNAGRDIAHSLSARYISYNDLSAALAQTISAVAQHRLSSRTASTIANLSRTLLQSVAGAENEYIATFGEDLWTEKIAENLNTLRPSKPGEPLRDDPLEDSDDDPTQEASEPSTPSSSPASDGDDQSNSAEDENQNEEAIDQQDEEQDEEAEEQGEQKGEQQGEEQDGQQNEAQDEEPYEEEDEPPAVHQITNYWETRNRTSDPTSVPKREPA